MTPDLPLISYSKFNIGPHFICGLFGNIKQLVKFYQLFDTRKWQSILSHSLILSLNFRISCLSRYKDVFLSQ